MTQFEDPNNMIENVGFDIYNPEQTKDPKEQLNLHIPTNEGTRDMLSDKFATNFRSPEDTVLSPHHENSNPNYNVRDNIAMMESKRAMT